MVAAVNASEPSAATLAALDIGTNSIHLVVARPVSGDRFETLTREREVVRLGSGGGDMKLLTTEALERGLACLARMKGIADGFDAGLRAVATSAVREATNASYFIERAARESGVHIEVISGVEEARLIHLGVLQAVPVFDRRLLLVDIGGGSTELLLG
jgi:exopolyphosphatase/guanosine-5'-triphosphate,3'-diphosphate pyrophosphatase